MPSFDSPSLVPLSHLAFLSDYGVEGAQRLVRSLLDPWKPEERVSGRTVAVTIRPADWPAFRDYFDALGWVVEPVHGGNPAWIPDVRVVPKPRPETAVQDPPQDG